MVRPKHFGFNTETAVNNSFQVAEGSENGSVIQEGALQEFNNMVSTLRGEDIDVLVIEDSDKPNKTDAIFPNNWFTTHDNGVIATYPMYAPSRRHERREEILDNLKRKYGFTRRIDFEYLEIK